MSKLHDYPSADNTTPHEALSHLPSVFQAIGNINCRLRRTNLGSVRNRALQDACDKLNGQGAALLAIVRQALSERPI